MGDIYMWIYLFILIAMTLAFLLDPSLEILLLSIYCVSSIISFHFAHIYICLVFLGVHDTPPTVCTPWESIMIYIFFYRATVSSKLLIPKFFPAVH